MLDSLKYTHSHIKPPALSPFSNPTLRCHLKKKNDTKRAHTFTNKTDENINQTKEKLNTKIDERAKKKKWRIEKNCVNVLFVSAYLFCLVCVIYMPAKTLKHYIKISIKLHENVYHYECCGYNMENVTVAINSLPFLSLSVSLALSAFSFLFIL